MKPSEMSHESFFSSRLSRNRSPHVWLHGFKNAHKDCFTLTFVRLVQFEGYQIASIAIKSVRPCQGQDHMRSMEGLGFNSYAANRSEKKLRNQVAHLARVVHPELVS